MTPDQYLVNMESITTDLLNSQAVNLQSFYDLQLHLRCRDTTDIALEHADAVLAAARSLGLLGLDSCQTITRLVGWIREARS